MKYIKPSINQINRISSDCLDGSSATEIDSCQGGSEHNASSCNNGDARIIAGSNACIEGGSAKGRSSVCSAGGTASGGYNSCFSGSDASNSNTACVTGTSASPIGA